MKTNKNIHILTTDKPSRLFYNVGGALLFKNYENNNGVNIYITSDEEIKEGDGVYSFYYTLVTEDWYCSPGGLISKHNGTEKLPTGWKKIIVTTDQDLIKYDVQAIDDEFLEWFVKNPTCEEVGLDREHDDTVPYPKMRYVKPYKIIIPQEESKQETIEEFIKEVLESETFPNIAEYKKAERLITIGAKWQSERMYSEEEVIQLLQKALTHQDDREIGDLVTAQGELRPPNFYSWFEKFKKR